MDLTTTLQTIALLADDEGPGSPLSPPIHQGVHSSAASADEFAAMTQQPRHDRFYRRYGNPTQSQLEQLIAALAGAGSALATASGMGAISTAFLALVSQGDQIVAQTSMYGGTLNLLQNLAPRLGIDVALVDQTDPAAFEAAVTPRTKLIMVETPSNPLMRLTDVAAVAEIARSHGVTTIADNTVATPLNQRPLTDGIDLTVHSLAKSLSGHSDVLGGILLGRSELIEQIWETHVVVGSVISPMDAWLAMRGIRTFPMRAEMQSRTALWLAQLLEADRIVRKVNYPGLASHPQHELAKRQMRGYGGLLSFEVQGGRDAAERFIAALRITSRSASLGSTRTLAVRPAAMWSRDLAPQQVQAAGVDPGLIRLSVGLENRDDLQADIERGLAAASTQPARAPGP